MKKSLEDYKEMVVKPQFDWIKIHWKGWMLIMIISACIPYTNGGTATQYSVAKQGNTGAAGADAITVSITSSNGTVFKNNSGSTVLTAHVYKGAVEQTVADNGTVSGLGTIKWYKVGSDTAVATAKTLTVSANDVDNTQAYTCQLEG